MNYSILYAKLFGFYCVIVPLAMLINVKEIKPYVLEMLTQKTFIILTGLISLFIGLVIIFTHSLWHGWPIIITLIGYFAILKGIVRLFFTEMFAKYGVNFVKTPVYYSVAILTLVLGIILLYLGFK
ncbi:MAG: hypothetical protein ACHQJ6_06985 [Candidatus Berkiellales bacterium]